MMNISYHNRYPTSYLPSYLARERKANFLFIFGKFKKIHYSFSSPI